MKIRVRDPKVIEHRTKKFRYTHDNYDALRKKYNKTELNYKRFRLACVVLASGWVLVGVKYGPQIWQIIQSSI